MKTVMDVQNRSNVKRVSDKIAEAMVQSGTYKYCPKHEWKALKNKKGGK